MRLVRHEEVSVVRLAAQHACDARPAYALLARHRYIDAVRGKDLKRSEEHTSELQSLMRISYAVFCLKKKKRDNKHRQRVEEHADHTHHHKQPRQKHESRGTHKAT